MTVRRGTASVRGHGRRTVAFDGVRLALAGHAARGVRRRVPTARRWATSCPFCRAPILAGPVGTPSRYCEESPTVADVVSWVGVEEPAGAAVRSW